MHTTAPYEPGPYWKERLERDFSVGGAGFLGLGQGFNYWIYLRRRQAVRRFLQQCRVTITGARVADVGVGTGYWIPEWERQGADDIVGFDLTDVSVRTLGNRYPQYSFFRCDFGRAESTAALSLPPFHFIAAMDVLLHIVDESEFHNAVANLARLAAPGARILLSDLFLPVDFRVAHQYSRSLPTFKAVLGDFGFSLRSIAPVFFSLHPSHLLLSGWRRSLSEFRWRVLAKGLRMFPPAGWPLGAAAFALDSALSATKAQGPSAHITLWERR